MKAIYTIGVNFLHSDSSACIFKDNELIFAAEEERYNRIKHSSNFPRNAIQKCIDYENINYSDIKYLTINSNPKKNIIEKIKFSLKNFNMNLIAQSLKNTSKKISLKDNLTNINKNFRPEIFYIDHHLSHISSAIFFSNFYQSINVSVDGFGDFESFTISKNIDNKISFYKKVFFPHSLGIFYQAITQFLGFSNYGDEYKVMGLAAYGKAKYVNELSKAIYLDDSGLGFELDLQYFEHHKKKILSVNENGQAIFKKLYSKKIFNLIGEEREKNQSLSQKHFDIAKSAQVVYENILFKILNNISKITDIKNLTLTGGCAMNSSANGKILDKTDFENIYIPPNPGDGGGSIGSASYFLSNLNSKNTIQRPKCKNYAYLGDKFSNDEIEKILKTKHLEKFKVEKILNFDELSQKTSNAISKSSIVGWYQDRMEWGPRALGNRSILADPRNPKIRDIINSKIKRRESFRPFAPAVIKSEQKNWFNCYKSVPFMSEVYEVKHEKKKVIPSVVHVDNTCRLQTVSEASNLKFFKLIQSFNKITNVPILLNTSFNENEPIVCNPNEALDCFLRTDMDVIVMENFFISR